MDKSLKQKISEKLASLGKISFKPNRSYTAVWLKHKKESNLILCVFQGKKKVKICLPWSTYPLEINNNLPAIISAFLEFKKTNSISKNIKALEKQLKESNLI